MQKLKYTIILALVCLGIGIAFGYYLGYDAGFEKAAKVLIKP